MSENANLESFKTIYERWAHCKGLDTSCWLDALADNVVLRSVASDGPGLAFTQDRHSRNDVAAYFTGLSKDWLMEHWTPETFICDGDNIAMFGTCGWTNKTTGKTANVRAAHHARYENGKIVEFTEIFDTGRAIAAATP